MKEIRMIYTTIGNIKDARSFSKILLKNRLAKCVNIIKELESFYLEDQKIKKSKEYGVIIKTTYLKKDIVKVLIKNHTYEIPFLGEIKLKQINKNYLVWASSD